MDLYGKFYNPNKILSYGRVYNYSIGSRTIGKSTGFALKLAEDFLKYKKMFIYVRRTKDELEETAPTYFDTAIDILRDHGYKINDYYYRGKEYYINGEIAGFAIPLGLQQKYKSRCDFGNVWWILYDEFMIDIGSRTTYLGGSTNSMLEVDAMSSLLQTVDRCKGRAARNECRVICVGNAGTFFNPFFIKEGIDKLLRPDTKYLAPKNKMYVLEKTNETEATKDIKESNAYKTSRQAVIDYAYNNKFADLTGDKFIIKKPVGPRYPLFNFIFEGETYGVFSYDFSGYVYICHEKADGRQTIALNTSDHGPNYLMIKTWHGHPATKLLKEMYDKGCVRFNDHKCKMVLDFYLRYDV